ncbi:helix-turn-helix transcriptional regulator [Candidatus Gottesmanbacteria bacterium]|nr:helix-turn-helix transcriptional regulator [Candidatus Gottesmanbacteria bacterium]
MKPKKQWITHEELKADLMKDAKFRRAYEALEPEFQVASQMIEARIRKKMSQQELARRARTGQAVISRLEGMNARPSISLLARVAQALETKFQITIG